jgi:hypothetical protein
VTHLAALRLGQQPHRGTNLSRRAVTALKAIILNKRRLHRMELIVLRQSLDRRDLFAFTSRGQRQAGENAPSVDENRAGSALALVAAFLRTGESEPFAQRVEQHHPRIDL